MSPLFRIAAVLVATTAAACSGDDDHGGEVNCEAETRDEEFTAGMEKIGTGGRRFVLASSSPAPPSRDNNTWEISIDQGGVPYEGVVEVTPFMPDHRHGTAIEAVVTPVEGMPGRYRATPVNLFMPGLWDITVEARPSENERDSVVFRFCITG